MSALVDDRPAGYVYVATPYYCSSWDCNSTSWGSPSLSPSQVRDAYWAHLRLIGVVSRVDGFRPPAGAQAPRRRRCFNRGRSDRNSPKRPLATTREHRRAVRRLLA